MITLKAIVEGIQSRKDNTLKLTFGTQEMADGGKLFSLQNKMVTLGIAENEISPNEIKLLQEAKLSIEDVPNGKSQSKRLRDVLFIYWEQHETKFKDFNNFYNDYTNQIIDNIKSKLD